jgi:hypothetical protein
MKGFGLRFLWALWLPFWLGGFRPPEDPRIDEQMIRDAMREEIFDQIAQKAEARRRHVYRLCDYLTNEAYDAVQKRLTPEAVRSPGLKDFLKKLYMQPSEEVDLRQFRERIDRYTQGMGIEVRDTIQIEYDQVTRLIEQVWQLNRRIETGLPPGDREAVVQAARELDLPSRFLKRLEAIEEEWERPAETDDSFTTFTTLKKNITGVKSDEETRLVFRLGDKYKAQFPFIADFLRRYKRLAQDFLDTALKTRELLARMARSEKIGMVSKNAITVIQSG